MLRPIPQQLLRDMVIIKVCTGMDAWQEPTWEEHTVKNVHIQNTNEIRKTSNNTEVLLRSILFIDVRRSQPQLDYEALLQQSLENGHSLRAVVKNAQGSQLGDFEVLTVDPVPDVPSDKIHHIELGLI